MRANLLDELHKPYVTTARAKGLSEWGLVLRRIGGRGTARVQARSGRGGGAEKGCSVDRAFVRTMLWGEWEGYWRLRVGEYRVIYEIDDRAHRVIIIRVRHRSEAYDRP